MRVTAKQKKRTKKNSIKKKVKFFILSFLSIILLLSSLFLMLFDKNVLPTALKISEKYAVDIINQQINDSVNEIVTEKNITTTDFFENSFNDNKQMNYLSVNSLLINEICSKAAVKINEKLKYFENENIDLPIGIFSGIPFFSAYGPKYSIKIYSSGETYTDYETSFASVGINQINFQIWLTVETKVTIVNPLYEKDVSVKRKLMLVNTIYNGDVPNTYLNGLIK